MTNQARMMKALGDPTRRQVFEALRHGPRSVAELHRTLPVPISRPAVSQHLKVLKEAGLVTDRAQATRRVYRVDVRALEEIRAYFDRFWGEALLAFKDAAEGTTSRGANRE